MSGLEFLEFRLEWLLQWEWSLLPRLAGWPWTVGWGMGARVASKSCRVVMVAKILPLCLLEVTVHCFSFRAVGITGCGKTSPSVNETCPNCAKLRQTNVFDSVQEAQCQDEPALLSSLSKGARSAIIDCQLHFRESRWNCSTLYGEHLFGAFVANSE